jgi:CHAT domain-containing protein
LLEIARDLARTSDSQIQLPYVHHALARAYYSDGQTTRALREFESAVQTMREWRLEVLPADSFRVASEAYSQQIFTDYIDAGMALYRENGDQAMAARMLEVAEDSRNWLAQQALVEQKELPSEYWQTLSLYRQALARSVDAADARASADAEKYRLRLSDLEARLGIKTEQPKFSHQIFERVDPGNALHGLRRKLKPGEAFLSFHAGTETSYVWAVTAESFEAHRLPGSGDLQARIREFRSALLARKPGVRRLGKALAQSVTGPLSPGVRRKREWILSLDGPLFDLPFAALPDEDGWLGGNHSLRLSSSALNQRGPAEQVTNEFVAMADPVYNRADGRNLAGANKPVTELPRLHGTAREATSCARAWGRDTQPEVLTGTAVTRDELMRAVAGRPAVLHLAAHVIPHPTFQDQVLVALGLQQSGQMDYLAPADIAFSRMRVGLVTLSGCGSGRGAALPGLGLFGLTRAWLMAGATAVVASHWPIADDSGELLAAMYEQLGQSRDGLSASKVADALQAAQLRMIQAGGWRSDPVYWSAFAVIGKD